MFNSGIGGGVAAIGQSDIPLGDGLEAYFGKGSTSILVTALALTFGLGASLPTQIYGYGRILFSLSRAGYIPRWLSITSKKNTPYRALIFGTVLGLICVILIDRGKVINVDAVILNMSVFGAVISYILVMCSYIKLKLSRPDLLRPYESPLGIRGAMVGAVLAIFALVACLSVPTYRTGLWGVALIFMMAICYFFFYSRHQLVSQAPEEAALMIEPFHN